MIKILKRKSENLQRLEEHEDESRSRKIPIGDVNLEVNKAIGF